MSAERIAALETELAAAQERIVTLQRTATELTESLARAETALKRSRRNARQDGNTMRDQITLLQGRR